MNSSMLAGLGLGVSCSGSLICGSSFGEYRCNYPDFKQISTMFDIVQGTLMRLQAGQEA